MPNNMLPQIGVYTFLVDTYLCDLSGKATLSMLGNCMLQVAVKHADERGFGYNSMTDTNRTWVLSRLVIELSEYPKNESTIKIHTWVADTNKLFTERCFAIEDVSGKMIGYARSTWALIDLETRRPTNILELEGLSDYILDHACPIEAMRKIQPIKEGDAITGFTVKYSDIDINKHLNSMKNIDHFIDVFDIEMFKEKEIRRLEIAYLNEAHFGSKLEIFRRDEEEGSVVLEMKNGDATISASRITWA